MKFYLKNYTLKQLQSKIIDLDNNYLKETKHSHMIYSIEGLFEINENKIYKIKINDVKSINICMDNNEYLVDKSIITKENAHYIPFSHTLILYETKIYSIYPLKNSIVKLYIIFQKNNNNYELCDFYFEILGTHNLNINQELSVFLSLLN
jgi:hypothetical protein